MPSKKKKRNTKVKPVDKEIQKQRCRTCPFGGEEPIQLSPMAYNYYYTKIVTFESSHECHSARDVKKSCRGARDIQLKILYRIGIIDEPTDEAFDRVNASLGYPGRN